MFVRPKIWTCSTKSITLNLWKSTLVNQILSKLGYLVQCWIMQKPEFSVLKTAATFSHLFEQGLIEIVSLIYFWSGSLSIQNFFSVYNSNWHIGGSLIVLTHVFAEKKHAHVGSWYAPPTRHPPKSGEPATGNPGSAADDFFSIFELTDSHPFCSLDLRMRRQDLR